MKGFALARDNDFRRDVVIKDRDIVLVDGDELLRQTCECVIQTNLGEWFINPEEGIDFHEILIKNPDYDEIRAQIQLGLQQVDDTFSITSFEYELTERKLEVKFEAVNSSGVTVTGSTAY